MPIYEFACNSCGKNFEKLVMTTRGGQDVRCVECDSPNVRKKISVSSYRTDKGSSIPAGALSGCSSKSGFS